MPADLKLPDNFVEKQAVSPTLEGPLSRATRRQSLSEIGFGRMDTYTKLDKLGEVSGLTNTKKRNIDLKKNMFLRQYNIYVSFREHMPPYSRGKAVLPII